MKKRHNILNNYYHQIFGEKISKAPIDTDFDCLNRGGTIAHGGCTSCTVSGPKGTIIAPDAPIRDQFYKGIDFICRKWPDVRKYLVYFQNFTNTRDTVDITREHYKQAINEPRVVGINIGTRPGYLSSETITYITELSNRMYVTVELDLQTTYDETPKIINRTHTYDLYIEVVKRLRQLAPKVEIVSYLANGLPDETYDMTIENVKRCVTDSEIDEIKLHLLHLITSMKMQRDCHEGHLKLLDVEEYVSIICDQLEIIPKNIIIHRIMGNTPHGMFIGPMWSLKKWEVLNAINKEMERHGSYQECKLENRGAVLW